MKGKNRSCACFSLLALFSLLSFIIPGRATAETLDVCSSGCTYSTINNALEASNEGDTIRIAAGKYSESGLYVADKKINIEGGWNPDFTGRNNNPSSTVISGDLAVDLTSSGGTINLSNLTISSPSKCLVIRVTTGSTSPVSINLSGVILKDAEGAGLEVLARGNQSVYVNLTNCILHSNGKGIFMTGYEIPSDSFGLSLVNCTLALNIEGGVAIEGGHADITNSILWHNGSFNGGTSFYPGTVPSNYAADIILGSSAYVSVSHSLYTTLVNSGVASHVKDLGGNLSGQEQDPAFRNAQEGDFRLLSSSPCIDAGTGDVAPDSDFEGDARPLGQGVDMGADEYNPCLDDTVPPAPVTGLGYDATPFTISLHWDVPGDNPYDLVRFFRVGDQQRQEFLSEVGAGQQSVDIDNTFWGDSFTVRAVSLDKCGNSSLPVDIQVNVPEYRQVHCPGGAFSFPDLSSEMHVSNISGQGIRYFAYGFDENGTSLWEYSGNLSGKSTQIVSSQGGLSSSIFAEGPVIAHVEMHGLNGTSAMYACSPRASDTFFMAENACSEEWWSGVLLFNPSGQSANVTLTSNPALLVPGSEKVSVPSGGSAVVLPPCQALSGTFHSTAPIVAMQMVGNRKDNGADIGATLMPGQTSNIFYLTGIHDGTESWTGFAVYVPGEFQGQADIRTIRYSGDSKKQDALDSISARSRKAFNLSEKDIEAMAIYVVGGDGLSIGLAGMAIQSSLAGFDLLAPVYVDMGSGFVSGFNADAVNRVYFFNSGPSPSALTCTYYGYDGQIIRQVTSTISAGKTLTISLQGDDAGNLALMEFSAQHPVFGFLEWETPSSLSVLPFFEAK